LLILWRLLEVCCKLFQKNNFLKVRYNFFKFASARKTTRKCKLRIFSIFWNAKNIWHPWLNAEICQGKKVSSEPPYWPASSQILVCQMASYSSNFEKWALLKLKIHVQYKCTKCICNTWQDLGKLALSCLLFLWNKRTHSRLFSCL